MGRGRGGVTAVVDLGPVTPSAPIAAGHGVGKQHKRRQRRQAEESAPPAGRPEEASGNEPASGDEKGRLLDDYA